MKDIFQDEKLNQKINRLNKSLKPYFLREKGGKKKNLEEKILEELLPPNELINLKTELYQRIDNEEYYLVNFIETFVKPKILRKDIPNIFFVNYLNIRARCINCDEVYSETRVSDRYITDNELFTKSDEYISKFNLFCKNEKCNNLPLYIVASRNISKPNRPDSYINTISSRRKITGSLGDKFADMIMGIRDNIGNDLYGTRIVFKDLKNLYIFLGEIREFIAKQIRERIKVSNIEYYNMPPSYTFIERYEKNKNICNKEKEMIKNLLDKKEYDPNKNYTKEKDFHAIHANLFWRSVRMIECQLREIICDEIIEKSKDMNHKKYYETKIEQRYNILKEAGLLDNALILREYLSLIFEKLSPLVAL